MCKSLPVLKDCESGIHGPHPIFTPQHMVLLSSLQTQGLESDFSFFALFGAVPSLPSLAEICMSICAQPAVQAFIKHLAVGLRAVGSQMDKSESEGPTVAEPSVEPVLYG